ncbi:MAG: protein kinase [Candidatus Riflebacteria bacterium]|nr:protein kinase [Candidatus Riflebacteria bacterium]
MDFPQGLDSTYEPIELIGHGGFAQVFRVRHRQLGRDVALKLMVAADVNRAELVRRCRREVELLARLSHPGLVRVLDVGEVEGQLYYTMELIQGLALSDVLTERRLLPWPEAVRIVKGVAESLTYVHAQGIIHRDIKPENILLEAGHRPVLVDFGLAYVQEATVLTRDSQVIGPPSYMRPEQSGGGAVTPATDTYQLGVVLFRAVTGQLPFDDPNFAALCVAILDRQAPLPSRTNPAVPRELDPIVGRCLAKEPLERFGSTGELAEALGRLEVHTGSTAARPGPPRSPAKDRTVPVRIGGVRPEDRPTRRGPNLLALACAGVLALAVGCLVWRRPAPALSLAVGQRALAVSFTGPVSGSIPMTLCVTTGDRAPRNGRWVDGALRFDDLAPDTDLVLAWEPVLGPRRSWPVRTLPDLAPSLDVEVESVGHGRLQLALSLLDRKPGEVPLRLYLGDAPLEQLGPGRFACPLPRGPGLMTLCVKIPGVGETVELGMPLGSIEALTGQLAQLERELERHLKSIQTPAWFPPEALAPIGPIRMGPPRPGLTGPASFLDRLRRLGPAVTLAVSDDGVVADRRWPLVEAVSRLFGAEALAKHRHESPLGLMRWIDALFKIENLKTCFEPGRPMLMLLDHSVHLAHPRFGKSGAGAALEAFSPNPDTKVHENVRITGPVEPVHGWIRVTLCGQGVSTSGAPIFRFPRLGIAVEVPLVLSRHDDRGQPLVWVKETFMPVYSLILSFKHDRQPTAGFGEIWLEPTYRPASLRITPCYLFGLAVPLPAHLAPGWPRPGGSPRPPLPGPR